MKESPISPDNSELDNKIVYAMGGNLQYRTTTNFKNIKSLILSESQKKYQEGELNGRIDELSKKRTYHIDEGYSDHYHEGFKEALNQVALADSKRLGELNVEALKSVSESQLERKEQ